ncbi:MAG: hypothetical protein KF683_19070 [Rubrivivax sp.]|nr:hypothetical protein [Rubrivivax sp.]
MSWVEKELKRRSAAAARDSSPRSSRRGDSALQSEPARIAALWARIESANSALPSELRLSREPGNAVAFAVEGAAFEHWLVAPDGAAIGFNGDGIRYQWPEPNPRNSNNFWIRWREGAGYVLHRRVGSLLTGTGIQERRFDESRIERLLRCLVTGERVRPRTVTKRRFWLL